MDCDIRGMVREADHTTSVSAARNVKARRFTLREQVIEFAKASLAHGLTDDDLKAAWPERPESSMRKRRTELAQENILVENGFTRRNAHGQDEKVWVHRDFHPSPPPIVERDTTPKQSEIVRLRARVADLEDIVTLALPYIETCGDAVCGQCYQPLAIDAMTRRMRAAISS